MDSSQHATGPPCLTIDIETSPDAARALRKIAAWRADTDERVVLQGDFDAHEAVAALDRLATGAGLLVGHNVVAHDLPCLRERLGPLAVDRLPVVDTLLLSPIAFPQNPYHRLVKGYKLVRDTRADPLRDCQLSHALYRDEVKALSDLHEISRAEAACQHFLLAAGGAGGLDTLFAKIRGARSPGIDEVGSHLRVLIGAKTCSAALGTLLREGLNDQAERQSIAYTLAWLRVCGGNSVLPPWVSKQFPASRRWITRLRGSPCGQAECAYCSEYHDPRRELHRHFGFSMFRAEPVSGTGGSLQEEVVLAGMRAEHLLAILPTGAGKSLCYQLPALSRYFRTGQLTIIISPLQSLMKDQVDGLVRQGIFNAAALNGLLSMPERKDVLERVRLGDIAILLISPEQLRSRGFVEAVRYRDIGAWVFDEAHCLSKWGHDFRTDYLYAARFIRERHGADIPQFACFTATAKLEVIADLDAHFRDALGIRLRHFAGGHERVNLHFEVLEVKKQDKLVLIQQLLTEALANRAGGAIVFSARRKSAEVIASFLRANGWPCSHFHAGLTPEVKKHVQQAFIEGDLRVIAATNAFGMGVDKPDVRLVIHAETPGSLENYLQETGRAGRDQDDARCVLLYDEEDVEVQFGIASRSRLSQRDIAEILKLIRRRSAKTAGQPVVITSGELLADEDLDISIDPENPDADTRVRTAIAWLERARLLQRDENFTRIFPGSLRVNTLDDARAKLVRGNLSADRIEKYLELVSLLMNAEPNEGISTDYLMQQTGLPSDECVRVLHALEQLGVLANDLQISVYLRKGIADASSKRLERVIGLEKKLIELLAEWAPDATEDGWLELNLRLVTQRLKEHAADGGPDVLPDDVLRLLRLLGQPFGGSGAERRGLAVRKRTREQYRVKLDAGWSALRDNANARAATAVSLLNTLLGKLPAAAMGADLLVEAKAGELCQALRNDIALLGLVRDEARAMEQALLYLDALGVIVLDRGRAVFRSAMTIRVLRDESRRRFGKTDFAPLAEHYRERNFQIHVMQEYARRGLRKLADALAFVAAYFAATKTRFVREYFADRKELLDRATTGESFRRIVEELHHPVQQSLVADESEINRLVLAGPGAGKTRVIVHRAAYLLRVMRVPSESIIVLAFNRSAAIEIRKRLRALVDHDAAGVLVMTYHAMALRLTGTSLEAMAGTDGTPDFTRILADAVDLLEGRSRLPDEADELRDRLLRGYRYILVDEYQDIDELQYRLVSALAGRGSAERDVKPTILAVGDDDQNIYAFRDANVGFIRRFEQDFAARVEFLVENFRSTAHIIQCANAVIAAAPDRLKAAHPIRINYSRRLDPPGGVWAARDPLGEGRVRIVRTPADPNVQAQLAMAMIERLRSLDPACNGSDIAVLARTHRALTPLRAYCEQHGIAYAHSDPASAMHQPRLRQTREGHRLARALSSRRTGLVRVAALQRWLAWRMPRSPGNPWVDLLHELVDDLATDGETGILPVQHVLEALAEVAPERGPSTTRGLTLSTVHGAKGREYRHVLMLDGGWSAHDEERRLYYVGMTRARETLTLFELVGRPNPFSRLLVDGVAVYRPERTVDPVHAPTLDCAFVPLGFKDVDLGYAGRAANPRIREAIARLTVGTPLALRVRTNERELLDADGVVVGRLAKSFELPAGNIQWIRVSAIVCRVKAHIDDPKFRAMCRVDEWETVLGMLCIESREPQAPGTVGTMSAAV